MTTLGDPLIDLGTLLNYWPEEGDPEGGRVGHDGMSRMGLPKRAELIARYGERAGLDVSQAHWYEAFALPTGRPPWSHSSSTFAGRRATARMSAWRRRAMGSGSSSRLRRDCSRN